MAGKWEVPRRAYRTNYYPEYVERVRQILPDDPLYKAYLDNGGHVVYPRKFDPRTKYPQDALEQWYPARPRSPPKPPPSTSYRWNPPLAPPGRHFEGGYRLPPLPPAVGETPPPRRPPSPTFTRDEYDEAVRRNLHVWNQWRTDVNDGLIDDIFTGRSKDLPPLEEFVQSQTIFDNKKILKDPVSLMKYSVGENQVTDLPSEDFLQFGIPRVAINISNSDYKHMWRN